MAQTSSSSNPVAIVSPQFCSPYPVELKMMRKTVLFGCDDFDVTDSNANLIFNSREMNILSCTGKQVLFDATGKPIVTIRSKAWSNHCKKMVFRGESKESKDLLFTTKIHAIFNFKTKVDVFLPHNTSENVSDFQLKGHSADRHFVVYAGDGRSNEIVARIDQKYTRLVFGKEYYTMRMNPNIDQAFIVALAMILVDLNGSNSS